MDTQVTLSPGEILKEVAEFMMDEYPDVSLTVPKNTTWRQAIWATLTTLEDKDAAMTIKDTRTETRRVIESTLERGDAATDAKRAASRARLRQAALENVAYWSQRRDDTPLKPNIMTKYDTGSIPPRAPASEKARRRLKETMIDPKF
ncbi:hypothetical protein O988_04095 [Pseudogymnoascus sp. VKM F-3808]|nr:hypothetical protein O988_04095 [Pseudogymnoascus sp. VKM F-3808]